MIPYSAEVFFAILAEYNLSVWPAHLVALVCALAATGLVVRVPERAGVPLALLLAVAWGWTGLVYFLGEFTTIDFWAYGFAGAFVAQAVLILWAGPVRGRLQGGAAGTGRGGILLMILALAVHPLLALGLGRDITEAAWFGVAPGPTVLFTLGALVWLRPAAPLYLFVMPVLWCVIAGAVALELGTYEDLALPTAAALSVGLLFFGRGAR